jgi:dTDP-4-amino-4,6-dideoxygalactose transaminase
MLHEIRPVGNKIAFNLNPLDDGWFSPYYFKGYHSGTAALAAALMYVKNSRRDISNPSVLLPTYTCPDLISAINFAGMTPVLVDLEKSRPWMSIVDLESKLDSNCVAIIAINFLGIPERIARIKKAIQSHRLTIIEDSAQGLPCESQSDYWQGDIIITSFGRGKPLGLLGGGAVFCRDKEILSQLMQSQNSENSVFDEQLYRVKVAAFNFLSSPLPYFFVTRMPLIKLGETRYKALNAIENLPQAIRECIQHNYQKYRNYHATSRINEDYHQFFSVLNHPQIIDLAQICNLPVNYPLLRFPVIIQSVGLLNLIEWRLSERGLGCSRMYKTTLPNIEGVEIDGVSSASFPNAEDFSDQLLTLPNHDGVSSREFKYIRGCIESACEEYDARRTGTEAKL